MQNFSKRDRTLRESDVLSDMSAAEREVLTCYAVAMEECASNSLRAQMIEQFEGAAIDMAAIDAMRELRAASKVLSEKQTEDVLEEYKRRRKELTREQKD